MIKVLNGHQRDRATITDEEDIVFDYEQTHNQRLKQLASLRRKKSKQDKYYRPGSQQLVRLDDALSVILRAYADAFDCSSDQIVTYMLREHLEGGAGHAIFDGALEKGLKFSHF